MTKTRKALIVVLSVLCLVCMGLFTLTACSKKTLESIKVTTPPTKTVYATGETFDKTGMVVTAHYSDNSDVVLADSDWDYDVKDALTVPDDKFETTQAIKVTYSEKDKSVDTTLRVTVTNSITNATIKTPPTQQEYFLGQSFSVDGLVISATLQSGKTVDIEVTSSNCKINPDGVLGKNDTEVTVSIGGYDLKVPVTILNSLYVEAETGYRNGALIEQSTGDTGNLRVDATTAKAQEGAQNLYASHLKAQFAVSKMLEANADLDVEGLAAQAATAEELSAVFGGTASVYKTDVKVGGKIVSKLYVETVKWIKDTANKEALDTYVASDDYKNALQAYIDGENEDIKDWNYQTVVTNYTAHAGGDGNEYYLGQNNQGDVISFLFDSSNATTGSIAFRLSSAYLYIDSGWVAIAMGDIQFNKLCEFYVNGVKYDISDDVILEGGKTEDGSTNNVLWCNWKEVSFYNVAFVEGRNVIELRILNHGIAAQESYSFAANIDTLLVAPSKVDGKDSSELDTYPANAKATATASSITLSNEGVVTISGSYTGVKGYVADILGVSVGNASAVVVTDSANNTFTATVDVSGLALGDYDVTAAGAKLSAAGLTISDTVIEIGRNRYKIIDKEGTVVVNIDSDYAVTLKTATVFDENAVLDLKLEGDKVIYSITGSYEAEIKGFNMSNEADKAEAYNELAKALKGYFTNFRFESKNNWTAIASLTDKQVVTVVDDTTFTMSIDVTALTPANGVCMNKMAAATNPNSNGDYKPKCKVEGDRKDVVYNGNMYSMWIDSDSWTLVVIQVTEYNPTAKSFKTNSDGATLKVEGDKIYMVISGTSKNYEDADSLKAEVVPTSAIDAEDANDGNIIDLMEKVAFTFDAETGNYTITVELTDLAVGKWWMHFGPTSDGKKVDVRNTQGTEAVNCGGKSYQFLVEPQDGWTAYRLEVKTVAAAE